MNATLVIVENEADLGEAERLIARWMAGGGTKDAAKIAAQARLIAAYESAKWPARRSRPADLLRYLMDQHGLKRRDLVPLLGTESRVSEVLNGKKDLSLNMIRRLRARFGVSADLLVGEETSAGLAAE